MRYKTHVHFAIAKYELTFNIVYTFIQSVRDATIMKLVHIAHTYIYINAYTGASLSVCLSVAPTRPLKEKKKTQWRMMVTGHLTFAHISLFSSSTLLFAPTPNIPNITSLWMSTVTRSSSSRIHIANIENNRICKTNFFLFFDYFVVTHSVYVFFFYLFIYTLIF